VSAILSSMDPLQVGLAGYGTSGSIFHAPLIAAEKRLRLAAVMTTRREKVQRENPSVRIVSALRDLLDDLELKLIVVATPTSSHFEVARAALLAGKHVVVDKPMTVTVAEADELIRLASIQGLLLSVYQNRRWDGDFQTVRRIIDSGRLGTIFQYEAHYDRFRPWMKGGWREQALPGSGILYDLGSHLMDQAIQVFGPLELVMADVFRQRDDSAADDYFHVVLKKDRLRVILHASMFVLDPGPHYSVYGDAGSFLKYGMDPQEEQLRAGVRPGDLGWGLDVSDRPGVLTLADGSQQTIATERGKWESFYGGIADALTGAGKNPVDAVGPREVIALIESAVKGRG